MKYYLSMRRLVKMANRYKSKVVWISVMSLVVLILSKCGLLSKFGIDEGVLKTIIDSILSILVIFGILNNPVNKEGF
jgi:uncharacterized membrane protein